jgi:hypothetical protein
MQWILICETKIEYKNGLPSPVWWLPTFAFRPAINWSNFKGAYPSSDEGGLHLTINHYWVLYDVKDGFDLITGVLTEDLFELNVIVCKYGLN